MVLAHAFIALLLCSFLSATHASQVINAADPAFVRPLGRAYPTSGGLGFSWLGCGLHVSHTGTVLRATVLAHPTRSFKFATYETNEGNDPWQGVMIIPASIMNESFVAAAGGAGEVKILINMPPDYWANGADSIVILSLESDGTFNPAPPPPDRVLHVLGDSITAATNIRGGFPKCADEGLYADYSSSWAGIVCAFFGSSCTTVAVGGKGLVKNCCDTGTVVPQFYTQEMKNGADGSFDFKDAPPQGVLVYLGTNDYSGGASPALDTLFTAAFLALMKNVTHSYYGTPGAPLNTTFFAILGPMSPTLPSAAMAAAVSQGTAQGYNVVFVNATTACGTNLTGCTDGCAHHPGVASHRNIARIVAAAVEETLGWPVPGVL
jgi:hypothetical protein